jgi:hypothetical protein
MLSRLAILAATHWETLAFYANFGNLFFTCVHVLHVLHQAFITV